MASFGGDQIDAGGDGADPADVARALLSFTCLVSVINSERSGCYANLDMW